MGNSIARTRSTLVALAVGCAALHGSAATVRAAANEVQVTPEVGAIWEAPERAWSGSTVLLLHGFADDRDGAGDLTKRLAIALAESGIASLRINFRGEGDRLRTKIESTLTSRVEDTAAAHAFVIRQAGVDPKRIGVVGWSLGAATAIVTGAQSPAWFKSMVLWSSPSGDLFAQLTAKDPGKAALRDGQATEDIPGWKAITTQRSYYESFRGVNLDEKLARYPGAFLAVRGTMDFLPPRDADLVAIARGRPAEAVLLGGADHIFNVFQPELGHATRAVEVTVAWLVRTL
ncbi:alpha/beta hydrolase family protein [Horticoccus sp. 23ND18S-11]|uniref:alpha/beta hydrolase family protein n=1 Tax=Horticoccus sp. 23ND18S-11 TaxID=3391832 RepID=UPI0039C9505B